MNWRSSWAKSSGIPMAEVAAVAEEEKEVAAEDVVEEGAVEVNTATPTQAATKS